MDKKVLVIYYSQTGQLEDIVHTFCKPFFQTGWQIERIRVQPKRPFDFPWSSPSFFDAMPESVLGIPAELESITFHHSKYDLIVFAYQPWFLSPSIPATSLLELPAFQHLLKGTPVVTLIGARNMWVCAQERIKLRLQELGAQLVGNVALFDRHQNHVSAVTILYWMLTGKKDRRWGIFPLPGISQLDIAKSESYGAIVKTHLEKGDWTDLQPTLIQAKAVEIDEDLVFVEKTGSRLFAIWANVIRKKKNRAPWLVGFKYYLLFALFIVAPIVLFIRTILVKPFLGKRIHRKSQQYLALN
jgi:hypothetical protein